MQTGTLSVGQRLEAHVHSYLAKVDFIEYHLIGMTDAIESGCESQQCYDADGNLVVPFILDVGLCRVESLCDLLLSMINLAVGLVLLLPNPLTKVGIDWGRHPRRCYAPASEMSISREYKLKAVTNRSLEGA